MRVFSRSEGFTPVRIEHPFVPRTTADSGEFPYTGADQLDSTIPPFAKVGVESSNPFARFKLASKSCVWTKKCLARALHVFRGSIREAVGRFFSASDVEARTCGPDGWPSAIPRDRCPSGRHLACTSRSAPMLGPVTHKGQGEAAHRFQCLTFGMDGEEIRPILQALAAVRQPHPLGFCPILTLLIRGTNSLNHHLKRSTEFSTQRVTNR